MEAIFTGAFLCDTHRSQEPEGTNEPNYSNPETAGVFVQAVGIQLLHPV